MSQQKIPLAIIAGFLGAGKTTLLNNILEGSHGRRFAVLVNDFGAVNIDARLVTRVEGETISLANGCVCCTIRGDLVKAVLGLLERDPLPEYILIETSGVSDPAAAAMAMAVPSRLAAQVRLDAVITVVDAAHLLELDREYSALAADQIAAADIVILNKSDLVDAAVRAKVEQRIREAGPVARIVGASHCRVPLELLFESTGAGERVLREHHHDHAAHDHGRAFATWHWSHSEPLSFEAVYALFGSLPVGVFRAKGFLNLATVPNRCVELQMVGRRVTLAKGGAWTETKPVTDIVMIGKPGGVEPRELQPRLEACLARNAPPERNRMAEAVVEILRKGSE